eukprot:SAG11_NODE_9720_length_886_cov_0.841169_1_plen_141_part_00
MPITKSSMVADVPPEGGRRCTQTHVYEHPWERVLAAYNSRFPTHPRMPLLKSTAVSDESMDEETGILTYHRDIVLTADVPWVLSKITGLNEMEMSSEVTVDHFARTITMISKNITWRETVRMDEVCTYRVHDDSPDWCVT